MTLSYPGESHPANAAMLYRLSKPGVLKRKKPAQAKAWQVFPVLIRSMAALDCGVGGDDLTF